MSRTERQTIWPPYEAFYIHSMLFNAQSAVRSVTQINAIMHAVAENSPEDPVAAIPTFHILGELQNLIIQAAALSRYFWPVRSRHAWRGAQLRKAFGVANESPLRSRDLRNGIEHFDEQLDRYLEKGIVGNILPEYVGSFEDLREVPAHMFRAYYVDVGVFELLGKRYDVSPLAQEVWRLYEHLRRMDTDGGRL